MAVWKFAGNACDFVLVPGIAKEDAECGYLGRDTVHLVAEEDPDSLFDCLLDLDFGGDSTQRIACDQSIFTVAGMEFRRSNYASFRFLHALPEDGAQSGSLAQMSEVSDRGGIS
ncbi:hypothetical protein ABQJ54_14240 [Rhodanobacter sp. Si-c]|uniref:Uncharacterized protein n=1 Tax=Rhodanobacter lycopersici TaxID=3162487 RepID=A0ABV3QGD8_9GAMM